MTKTRTKTSEEIKARGKIFVTKTSVIDPDIGVFSAYLRVLYKLDLVKGHRTTWSLNFDEIRLYHEMVHELYPYLRAVKRSRKRQRRKPKR